MNQIIVMAILLFIFIGLPIMAIWAVKNEKITVEKEEKKADKTSRKSNRLVQGTIFLVIAIAMFGLGKMGAFEMIKWYIEEAMDVNGIAGPLPAMFGFVFFLGSVMIVLIMVVCFLLAIRSFWKYFRERK